MERNRPPTLDNQRVTFRSTVNACTVVPMRHQLPVKVALPLRSPVILSRLPLSLSALVLPC